ncbi:MAG: aldo/keto reductase [Planctomycetota bacterium]|jgi:aryl-alcohol dehydrogenase-like predicted oxidoreductase|nr:aldo/keto reductase [Planctomycetota bacterium]
MDYAVLKAVDLKVSRFALGTWGFSGSRNWGPNDEGESIGTIHLALDNGINFMDSAPKYNDGAAEIILGKAVKGRRDKVVIATKAYSDELDRKGMAKACEASLKRLGTDYIDLYQVHWPSRTIPFPETMEAFEKLKKAGKIRAIGVCNYGVECLEGAKGHAVATNQLPYSLVWRQVEDEIIPKSRAQGVSVWPYCPLAQGLLTGKFKTIEDVPPARRNVRFYSGAWKQGLHSDGGFEKEIFGFLPRLQAVADGAGLPMAALALAFLKGRPEVDSVLVGARSRRQLEENLKIFAAPVPPEVLAEAVRLSDELKPKMGKNPDLWQSENGGRFF